MCLVNAHQFDQLGANQLLQRLPKAHGSSVMKVIPNERDRFGQHKIGRDKGVPLIQQLFVCQLRQLVVGISLVGERVSGPGIHKHLVHTRSRE